MKKVKWESYLPGLDPSVSLSMPALLLDALLLKESRRRRPRDISHLDKANQEHHSQRKDKVEKGKM